MYRSLLLVARIQRIEEGPMIRLTTVCLFAVLTMSALLPTEASAQMGPWWTRAEYLQWWTKGNDLPALVTTSPPGTAQDDAGVLGVGGTEILFGAESIDRRGRSGLRVTLGRWLDEYEEVAGEITWFSVFDDAQSGDFRAASLGIPTLARPFFDVENGNDAAELTAYIDPNGVTIVEGGINISSNSEMHSGSISLRHLLSCCSDTRIQLLGGYRFFRYREGILVHPG
jgi:hypothetical protein